MKFRNVVAYATTIVMVAGERTSNNHLKKIRLKLLFETVISLTVDRIIGIVYNISKNPDKIELKKKDKK